MKNKLQYLLLATVIVATKAIGQTNVPATISSNQVWVKSGSPYIINQNTQIDSGVSVIVKPGVEVKSTNISFLLTVNGEFQCKGKKDTMIKITDLQTRFTKSSLDYNASTGRGAYFGYCNLSGPGSGAQTIAVYSTDLTVEYCNFYNAYYAIYGSSGTDSNKIHVDHSNFYGDAQGNGAPITYFGDKSRLYIYDNFFNSSYEMVMYGKHIYFTGNRVRNISRPQFYIYGSSAMACNSFDDLKQQVLVYLNSNTTKDTFVFLENTLDSIGSVADAMLKVYKNANVFKKFGIATFNRNNFLYSLASAKVKIAATNTDPNKTDTVNFKSNYWGTTSASQIDNLIDDYADNTGTYGRVNFANYLGQPSSGCTYNSPCNASFYFAVDTAHPKNLYIVNTSSGLREQTSYNWSFGDGQSSSASNPSHTYTAKGKYYVCLTIKDTGIGCNSTYCDSLTVDENGTYVQVINEDEVGLEEVGSLKGIAAYPNPSSGHVKLSLLSTTFADMELAVYDAKGQLLQSRAFEASEGRNELDIDLAGYENGLYCICIKAGDFTKTITIIVYNN